MFPNSKHNIYNMKIRNINNNTNSNFLQIFLILCKRIGLIICLFIVFIFFMSIIVKFIHKYNHLCSIVDKRTQTEHTQK